MVAPGCMHLQDNEEEEKVINLQQITRTRHLKPVAQWHKRIDNL